MDHCCRGDLESLHSVLSHCKAACSFVQISNLGTTFHRKEVPTRSAAWLDIGPVSMDICYPELSPMLGTRAGGRGGISYAATEERKISSAWSGEDPVGGGDRYATTVMGP